MTVLTLRLEAIGDHIAHAYRVHRRHGVPWKPRTRLEMNPRSPWVARLVGLDPVYGFKREFLRGQRDYTSANSLGSRGVMLYYHLEPGHVYEVHELTSWTKSRRYFCRVVSGRKIEISHEEAVACLI